MSEFLYVINSRGEKEAFSFQKVSRSAKRVGASKSLAQEIAKIIEKEAYPGIKTKDIFEKVRKLLNRRIPKAALKFNLKAGIRKLGPTGFLFEKYVAEIFSRNGFKVRLNQYISGFCCRYEIDFLAEKEGLLYIGECKYRNLAGGRVHSNIALANYARFLDIKKSSFFKKKISKNLNIKSILVTNTKFTSRAANYSKCVGVELLGWKYPAKRGLEYLIEEQELYPITVLPSLKKYMADVFVSKNMMLAKDILKIDIGKFAKDMNLPLRQLEKIVKDAKILIEQ